MPRKRDKKGDEGRKKPVESSPDGRDLEDFTIDATAFIPLADGAPIAIYLTDATGDCVYANPQWLENAGLTMEEARGKGWLRALHPDDRKRIGDAWYETVARGERWELEYRFEDEAGHGTWIHGTAEPLLAPDGTTSGYIGANIDITPLKAAEEAARGAKAALADAQKLAHIGSWEWDVAGQHLDWSDETYRIFGLDRDAELTFESIAAAIVLEDRPRNNEWVARLLEHGDTDEIELRITRPDGELRHIHQTAAVVRAEDGTPLRAHGTMQDITARKRAEEEAARHEVRLHALIENADFSIWAADREKRLVVANSAFHRRVGALLKSELKRGDPVVSDSLPEEAAKTWHSYYDRALAGEELRIEGPNPLVGEDAWSEYRFGPIVDRNGDTTGVVAMGRDVTEERRQREALRESEAEKDLILNSTAEMFAYYDLDLRVKWANKAAADSVGQTMDKLVGRHCYEIWHGSDEPCDGCPALVAAETRQPASNEMTTPDGRIFSLRSYPVLADGELVGLAEFGRDVTDSHKAREALRASEQRFRSFFERVSSYCYMLDPDGMILDINENALRALGYADREEVVGKSAIETVYAPESREKAAALLREWQETGEVRGQELQIMGAGGAERTVLLDATAVYDDEGDLVHSISVQTDVTELKQAMETLRESEATTRAVADFTHDWEYWLAPDGLIRYVSPSCQRITGYAPREFMADPQLLVEIVHPDDREALGEHIAAIDRLGGQTEPGALEFRIIRKDGEERWIGHACQPVFDADGTYQGVRASNRDITARRHADEELRRTSALLEQAQDIAAMGAWEYDPVAEKGDATDLVFSIFGIDSSMRPASFKDVMGRFAPESRGVLQEAFARAVRNGEPYDLELQFDRPDGRTIWIRTACRPIVDDGSVTRLTGTILDITERKEIEQALRESEERFRTLVENVPGVVFRCRTEAPWPDVFVSAGFEQLTGYSVEDSLSGRVEWTDVVVPEDLPRLEGSLTTRLASDAPYMIDYRIRRKSGELRWVSETGSAARDEHGRPLHIDGVIIDITDQKTASEAIQQSEERWRSLTMTSPDHILTLDRDLNIEFANFASPGLTVDDLIGTPLWSYVEEDRQAEIRAIHERVLETGEQESYDTDYESPDGRTIHYESRCVPRRDPDTGANVGLTVSSRDITRRVEAESHLRESEARYRELLETLQEGIWAIDAEARTTLVNPRMAKMLGCTVEEMTGTSLFDYMTDAAREKATAYFKRRREGMAERHDFEFLRKDGTTVYAHLATTPLYDSRGQFLGAIAAVADVTDQKRAEDEIREARRYIDMWMENNPSVTFMKDLDGHVTFVNPAVERLFGITAKEFVGKTDYDLYPSSPETAEQMRENDRRVIESGEPTRFDEEIVARGERRQFETIKFPLRDPEGQTIGVAGVARDVTERKLAEEALAEKTRELDDFFSASIDLFCIADTDGHFRRLNKAWEEVLGYPLEELQGARFLDFVHPDDMDATLQAVATLDDQQPVLLFTNRYRRKDGSYRWIEWRSIPRGTTIFAAARDITERREAEEALRQSEERFRTSFEDTDVPMALSDGSGRFLDVNEAMSAMLHYSREELLTMSVADITHPDDRDASAARLARCLESRRSYSIEKRYVTRDDEVRYALTTVSPVFDDTGGLSYVVAHVQDITERKAAEDALAESVERFRGVFDTSPAGITIMDGRSQCFIEANEGFETITGYSAEELRRLTIKDITHPDDWPREEELLAEYFAGREQGSFSIEKRYVRKDGGTRWVQVSGDRLRIDAHEPGRVIANVLDITDRKEAEIAIRAREERFRGVFDISPAGIAIVDTQTQRILEANEGFLELTGYSLDELTQMTVTEMTHPDDREREARLIAEYDPGPGTPSYSIDKRYIRKEGDIRWVHVTGDVLRGGDGGAPLAIANVLDITDRVKAKEALEASGERLHQTLRDTVKAMGNIVELRDPYTAGHEKQVTRLADAIADEMGVDETTREGLLMAGEVHDIGKIAVPAEILSKPSVLTAMEFKLVKQHSIVGHELVDTIDFEQPVAEIVLQHHERLDGSGYPRGLEGDEILLEARILAVADVVEAMASHRPYRPALGLEAALSEVRDGAGRLYDADVVAACERVFEAGFTLGT